MALGVLSYPVLSEIDLNTIQDFRRTHDQLYFDIAQPHVPFVFPTSQLRRDAFINEITTLTNDLKTFHFTIRCATINKDAVIDWYHMLLVPDEGYSDIVKAHDRLYGGELFDELRLDIDFIPHLAVANSRDPLQVKHLVDEWNAQELTIEGSIRSLTIVDYSDGVLTDLCEIPLTDG